MEAGILFAPYSRRNTFSVIAIQYAYYSVAPTAQKICFYYFCYRHFAPKGAAFLRNLDEKCIVALEGVK
jgi:hypothetical protein